MSQASSGPTFGWKAKVFALIAVLALVALFIFVAAAPVAAPAGQTGATPAPDAAATAANAAALLALITAAAVVIERVIEGFWSLAGQLFHGWWPFNKMQGQVADLETAINDRVKAVQDEIGRVLPVSGNPPDLVQKLTDAQAELQKLQGQLADLQKLAPGNQKVNLIAATVNQAMGAIDRNNDMIKYRVHLVNQSLAGLTDFVGSFKENPARRMVSVWLGALLGLIAAYVLRLDVFFAVLEENVLPAGWWPHLGIAFTGLIIGMGSSPTHDVIGVLQEVKKRRAGQNQPDLALEGETTVVLGAGGGARIMSLHGGAPPAAPTARPELPPIQRFR